MLIVYALLALQQSPAQTPEIARIIVTPPTRTMIAGDTLRLLAEARDSQNRVIPGVTFRFRLSGGARFEGSVDSLGLVTAGATSTLPVVVTATLPGAKPAFETIEIRALPGPAASIDISPATVKLVAGQRVRLSGRVFSAAGDRRMDRVSWQTGNASIATVDASGLVTAITSGTTTINASAGPAVR
jgi:hypothetical protein